MSTTSEDHDPRATARSLKATLEEIREAQAAMTAATDRFVSAIEAASHDERGWVETPASLGMLNAFVNEAKILHEQARSDGAGNTGSAVLVVGELSEKELVDLLRMGELALDRGTA